MFRAFVLALAVVLTTAPVTFAQNRNLPPVPRGGFAISMSQTGAGQFTAASGNAGSQNLPTWGNFYGPSLPTGRNSLAVLPTTTSMPFPGTYTAPGNFANRQMGMVDLPVTNMDSFVAQSGYDEDIYGDEGTYQEPPIFGFEEDNEIEAGIHANAGTLTTNHASTLPSAWGWTWDDGANAGAAPGGAAWTAAPVLTASNYTPASSYTYGSSPAPSVPTTPVPGAANGSSSFLGINMDQYMTNMMSSDPPVALVLLDLQNSGLSQHDFQNFEMIIYSEWMSGDYNFLLYNLMFQEALIKWQVEAAYSPDAASPDAINIATSVIQQDSYLLDFGLP